MSKEQLKTISSYVVVFLLGVMLASNGDSEQLQNKVNVLNEQVKSCQELVSGINGLFYSVKTDYSHFATDLADLMSGNISMRKFTNNVSQYVDRQQQVAITYNSLISKYKDRCFPKMGDERLQ